MSMTLQQAISALSNPEYQTIAGLRSLVSQVSVAVPNVSNGATTLLYSGMIGNLPAWQIAEEIGSSSDGRVITIGETPVAKLLGSNEFKDALEQAAGTNDTAVIKSLLDGTANPDGTRTEGMWDIASRNLAQAASGDVRTLTPFSDAGKVFAQTELPALLDNPNVTHIDGIPKEDLLRLHSDALTQGLSETQALDRVRNTVAAASLENTAKLHIAVDANGNILRNAVNGLEAIDTRAFFEGTTVTGSGLPAGTEAKGMSDIIHSIPETHIDSLRQGWQGLKQLEQYAQLDNAGPVLNKLGIVGDVIGLMLVAHDANAAYAAGDTAGAQTILSNWAIEFAGGLAGGLAAAQVVGSALAPLYLTGPAGALIAGALTLLAGLAGGVLGGEVALEVARHFTSGQSFVPPVRSDPLILDLDGDGLETIGPSQSGVLFDHNADNVKTGTGWVKPDDGFLVMDRNNNGVIDNGRELFGDTTPLYAGGTAADGFAALAQEDTNGDGRVDNLDANWSKLRIWRDLNQDGVSQSSELLTMSNAGIASFNVAKTINSVTLANGNQIADLGTYVKTDGTSGTLGETSQMADINLAQDTFHSQFTDQTPIDEDVKPLPGMQGAGLVRELRQAASLDTAAGNVLKTKLAAFANAQSGTEQLALIDDLLLAWADTSPLIASMQDRNPEQVNVIWSSSTLQTQWESKLHILEAFNGRYFFALPGDTQTGATSGLTLSAPDAQGKRTATVALFSDQVNQLQQAFDLLKTSVYGSLVLQTRLKPLLDKVQIGIDSGGARLDFSQLDDELNTRVTSNAVNGLADWIDLARYAQPILAGTGYDAWETLKTTLLSGAITADTLNALHIQIAGANNDIVMGANTDDLLFAGAANDKLYGNDGADALSGGADNDVLYGGMGSDTYLFNLGDGQDTIQENANEGLDVLRLGTGFDAASTQIVREITDLVLVFNANDNVRISNYFNGNRVEQISFADGTVWDYATVAEKVVYIGTANGDYLFGLWDVANRINGLGGNDYIYGANQDDALSGGAGNDSLEGGSGNDTYLFNLGDGSDTIREDSGAGTDVLQLRAGLNAADTQIVRENMDLVLSFNATDKVRISSYFNQNRLEQISFADGTAWNYAAVAGKLVYNGTANGDYLSGLWDIANRINGLGGDDTIHGADQDDVLSGGTGNDTLSGDSGNDTYVFNLGDGSDTISETTGASTATDVLQLGAGLEAAGTQISRENADLVLGFNASDKVRISGYFSSSAEKGRVEEISFADGTVWDYVKIGSLGYDGTAGVDYLYGMSGIANRINGMGGNDVIHGADQDDVLSGGTGNDTLIGDSGNDTYVFNLGDGSDTISETTGASTATDVLQLGAGLEAAGTQISRENADLVLGFNASDKVRISSYFSSSAEKGRVEEISFADGTVWDYVKIGSLGYGGTAGVDYLYGMSGIANRINGMGGNDVIHGADQDDVLSGGAGNDTLSGDSGNDTYVFNLGDGSDTISETTGASTATDVLQLGAGLEAAGAQISRENADLVLGFNASDKVRISSYFSSSAEKGRVEEISFADGTVWDYVKIGSLGYGGTAGVDYLYGMSGIANRINGMGGNDVIHGADQDDVLSGGTGNDTLIGNSGNDTYVLGRGDGSDVISENDSTPGNTDVAQFGIGIAADQLWFQHVGNNLEVSVIGTSDKLTIQNWYSGTSYHVEQFKTAGGKLLLDSQVENLVSAMAAFAPPSAGQTTLPQNYQDELAPKIAANWQ